VANESVNQKRWKAMEYIVKEPSTGIPYRFDAKPERYNGEQGYRIICSQGSNFFISNKYGSWRLMDDHHVDSLLLERIGLAIEEHVERSNTTT
jgi:hypothetical protein